MEVSRRGHHTRDNMSHRIRATETYSSSPATSNPTVPQTVFLSRIPADQMASSTQRYSMTSVSSSGRRSSSSFDGSNRGSYGRPSGIPRSTSASSQARLSVIASSRPAPLFNAKSAIPRTMPAIGTMNRDQIQSAMARSRSQKQQSTANADNQYARKTPVSNMDVDKDSVLGVAFPDRKKILAPATLPPRLIPELQALAASSHRPQITTGSISTVSSPSTVFTGSPSPWSASTAATTPVSWSSASPSITCLSSSPAINKRSKTVPIPSTARTRLPKLPAVQESASASNSSSRNNLQSEALTPPRRLRKKSPITSPVPTPPPRSSSIKRTRSGSSGKSEERTYIVQHDSPPPLPGGYQIDDALPGLKSGSPTKYAPIPESSNLRDHHNNLQDALNSVFVQSDIEQDKIHSAFPPFTSSDTPSQNDQTQRLLDPVPIVTSPQTLSSARSRLAKFSKMAFFGRTAKGVEPTIRSESQLSQTQRKGPTAGTGHEGYNKYTRRGRKSSIDVSNAGTDSESSGVSTTRKPVRSTARRDSSVVSRKSQSDLEDFVSSRLKPLVILGGSQKSSSYSRNHNGQIAGSASESSRYNEHNKPPYKTQFQPAVALSDAALLQHNSNTVEGDSRRLQRSPVKVGPTTSVYTEPVYAPASPAQPYLHNWNTSESSVAPSSVAMTDMSTSMYRIESNTIGKQQRRGRKLRWNIFKRRDSNAEDGEVMDSPTFRPTASPGMAVSVSTMSAQRSVPYYAMIESGSETNTTEALGDYLNEAAIMSDTEGEDNEHRLPVHDIPVESRQRHESVLLPVAPQYKPNIEPSRVAVPLALKTPARHAVGDDVQMGQSRRQPRLAQVGRIPKVVSSSQIRQPSRMSFSRPFQHSTAPEKPRPAFDTRGDDKSISKPVLEIQTEVLPSRGVFTPVGGKSTSAPPHPNISYARDTVYNHVTESLKLYDRQSTTSSSSDGMISVMGPPLLPVPDVIQLSSRRRTVADDDIWNEYDDFIDHVTSPPRLKKSSTHAVQVVAGSENQRPETANIVGSHPSRLPTVGKGLAIDTSVGPIPTIYASPEVLQESEQSDEIRLRRSRIVSALHSSIDPSSPFSIGDYFAEHNASLRDSARTSGYFSTSPADKNASRSPRRQPESLAPSLQTQQYGNAMHIDDVQRSKDPAKHSELSYTSLMVSRWLSFGRVLFSPAHADIQKQPERHILVVDGLGSDDWSIYCAVTYQAEQAYIYDLKETGNSRFYQHYRNSGNAPPNLRRREMASFYDPIKFPDNFFSAIVLRFPPVMAESKLRNMISECRRVLAPGGFMELMLLDLDIVNMGVLTRRALRELKTSIAMADPGVSLKPVMDSFQSVLGEKGFSKLSRCVVGVPVIGKPPGPTESPVSSRSSGGSDQRRLSTSAGPRPFDGLYSHNNHNFSLNDLVADHSDNADAKISKMVSRTARNWWQHCFEAAVIPDGDLTRSIFADRKVLNECKARASSFKLLIAYTQKPAKPTLELKRRTMSEPVVATLATA